MIVCNHCGSGNTKNYIKSFTGKTTSAHIGAWCLDCGSWIKWLSKEEKAGLDLTKIEEKYQELPLFQ